MGIKIEAKPRTALSVELVGTTYEVTPPKTALAIAIARQAKTAGEDPEKVMEMLNSWVSRAFGKKNATAIEKRLNDPEDDLDIEHIMELMEALIEESSENPTS